MTKHKNKEAFYERLRTLAQTSKPSLKESRTLGTLINYKHATNGIAYGIIKEQHQYYVKKAGLKSNPDVADFAYIGGVENITEHQYNTFASADKQRNMLFNTINEANLLKPRKIGGKKEMLTEDKAGEEIEMAASKVDDLEAATDAAEMAAEPEVSAEVPVDGGEESPIDSELPVDGGEELPDGNIDDLPVPDAEGGEELPIDPDAEGGEELPIDPDAELPIDPDAEGGEIDADVDLEGNEETRELEKAIGKLTNAIRKTDLEPSETKSFLNSFISSFKDKLPDIEIEDRKEIANKLIKVVGQEEINDLEQSMSDEDGGEVEGLEETGVEGLDVDDGGGEECSGFAQYADSLGHNAESMMNADDEEMTNVVSGFANAHNDGQNDGDFKAVALFITPEILDKLKTEYGHDDFANQVEPFANEMNECSLEEKEVQINELFGGLSHLAKKAGQGIKQGAQAVGQGIADKAGQVQQAVGNAATNVKQSYHAGEKNAALGKLEKVAADLGKQVAAVNQQASKAGQEPINVQSILQIIVNQVGSKGGADLTRFRTNEDDSITIEEPIDDSGIEEPVNESDIPADSVEVQPMIKENDKEEEIAIDSEVSVDEPKEEPVLDLTKKEDPEMEITSGFESMGGGVVKPDGAPTTTMDVTVDGDNKTVNVTMNESEIKVREYIRKRIKEGLGMSKPSLNENKKSKKLLKVDKMIAEQLALYESTIKKMKK